MLSTEVTVALSVFVPFLYREKEMEKKILDEAGLLVSGHTNMWYEVIVKGEVIAPSAEVLEKCDLSGDDFYFRMNKGVMQSKDYIWECLMHLKVKEWTIEAVKFCNNASVKDDEIKDVLIRSLTAELSGANMIFLKDSKVFQKLESSGCFPKEWIDADSWLIELGYNIHYIETNDRLVVQYLEGLEKMSENIHFQFLQLPYDHVKLISDHTCIVD